MAGVAEDIEVSESGYELPVADLLTGRGAIFGKSGSGKSNSMTVVAEELLEQSLPLLIVDQDGEYHGLKSEYDVLHVGADGECDRTVGVEDGEDVADEALANNQAVILDVSGFVEEETARELVHAVVRRLFVRENDVRKPFLLIVEEIHEYVPQQGGRDELGEMLIRVAKRGRKRGLGLCGVSQRPASVDKDFITQCDWIVWHRLTWNNDTKVVGRILGSEYAEGVQDLETGEAFVMADWAESVRRVNFRLKRTVDAGATPGLEEFGGDSFAPVDVTDQADADSAVPAESAVSPGQSTDRFDDGDTVLYPMDGDGGRNVHTGGDSSRTTGAPPGVVTDDDVHRGNPVWELGQMFVYVFGTVLFRLLNGVRRIVPLVTPWQTRPDPLGIPGSGSIDWKLASLWMVVLNLLLLVIVAFVYMFVLG